jgi:hypothetical protein
LKMGKHRQPKSRALRKRMSAAQKLRFKLSPHSLRTRKKIAKTLKAWFKLHPPAPTFGMLGKHHSPETKEKMRAAHLANPSRGMLGKHHSPETKEKMRAANLGKQSWWKGKKRSVKTRKRMSDAQKKLGNKHPFYVHGRGYLNKSIREKQMGQLDYKLWRETVFARDDRTCQICGACPDSLIADHVKSWRNFPDLRYEVENGRTLCAPCHRKTPNYGKHSFKDTKL